MREIREEANCGELDSNKTSSLFQLAYEALHHLADQYLKHERKDHTLQPTALVHEAFLKLGKRDAELSWESKAHFQAVAAIAMRQILVDHARRKATQKRGGQFQRVALSTGILGDEPNIDFVELDNALKELATKDERKAKVVELRYFGGLTSAETALQLGIACKTAEADWYFARAWLRKQLSELDS